MDAKTHPWISPILTSPTPLQTFWFVQIIQLLLVRVFGIAVDNPPTWYEIYFNHQVCSLFLTSVVCMVFVCVAMDGP